MSATTPGRHLGWEDAPRERAALKNIGHIVVLLTGAACTSVLLLDARPGMLEDLLFFAVILGVVAVPVAALGVLVTAIVLARKGKAIRLPARPVAVVLAMLFVTGALLWLHVPRRIGFEFSRSAFEQRLPESRRGDSTIARRIGLYPVDEMRVDARGGVYFRVDSGLDGISPDTMSYGFVHEPNDAGSPFGASKYRTRRLGGGWSWFQASNDWF